MSRNLKPPPNPIGFLAVTGRRSINSVWFVLELFGFIARTLQSGLNPHFFRNRSNLRALNTQIIFSGVDALPIVSFLGIIIGITVIPQILQLSTSLGDREMVALISDIVAIELGSLLTAILLITRSGSAITVDLGQMHLRREIEGLELLGINTQHLVIVPRVLGLAITQLTLAIYLTVIAVVSGIITSSLLYSTSYIEYLKQIPLAFDPIILISFILKNLVFGLMIGANSCFHALKAKDSITAIPRQTSLALISTLFIIIIVDVIFFIISKL